MAASSSEMITGGCNCGRHVFTIPKPTEMNLCHCIDCRKWAGSMHSDHMFVRTEDIEKYSPDANLSQAKKHQMKAESGGIMERAWCDECGCGLYIKAPDRRPEMTNLKAGLFQPKDVPNPTMENWLKNKQPWETPATGTKRTSDVN